MRCYMAENELAAAATISNSKINGQPGGRPVRVLHPLALTLLAAATMADAADIENHYVILGLGQNSCNSYNQARAAGDFDHYKGYITGYITAYNAFVPETYNIVADMDTNAVIAWMDAHCADSQTMSFADAMHALVDEMYEKRQKSSPANGARWP
jgi:hypothetical protein